jgi:hypothetical protein
MATILNKLPFSDRESSVEMATGPVAIRAFQILMWVSLSAEEVRELPRGWPRFPAVLDTGCNHNLALREEHFARWAGLEWTTLWYGSIRVNQTPVPLLKGKLWIHPNRAGERDQFGRRKSVGLKLVEGFPIYPHHVGNVARILTVGLRVFAENNLHLAIDGKRRLVTLRTARDQSQ